MHLYPDSKKMKGGDTNESRYARSIKNERW